MAVRTVPGERNSGAGGSTTRVAGARGGVAFGRGAGSPLEGRGEGLPLLLALALAVSLSAEAEGRAAFYAGHARRGL